MYFLRAVCKKIRASVKSFVKMSNGTVKLLGSRRPCLKTPIFTMKNEHFFYRLFTRVCKISFCYPSLLKCYFLRASVKMCSRKLQHLSHEIVCFFTRASVKFYARPKTIRFEATLQRNANEFYARIIFTRCLPGVCGDRAPAAGRRSRADDGPKAGARRPRTCCRAQKSGR